MTSILSLYCMHCLSSLCTCTFVTCDIKYQSISVKSLLAYVCVNVVWQDKWVCPECENENKALHRYCDFCWNLRPDWLPSNSGRPMTHEHEDSRRVVETQSSPDESRLDSGIMSVDSCHAGHNADECNPASSGVEIPVQSVKILASLTKLPVNASENEITTVDTRDDSSLSAEVEYEDKSRSRRGSDIKTLTDLPSSAHGGTSSAAACVICLLRPKNASIVHGATGHQTCCFRCARQLKQTGKPCPVCRRPIHKVIRNYIV